MKLYEAVRSCCEAVVKLYESRMFVGVLKIEKRINLTSALRFSAAIRPILMRPTCPGPCCTLLQHLFFEQSSQIKAKATKSEKSDRDDVGDTK